MRSTTLAAVLLIGGGSGAAFLFGAPQGQSRKQALEQQLQAQYPPTKLAGDRLRIAQPGTVLLIRVNGMVGSPMKEYAFSNSYKDGRIKRSVGSALIHDSRTSRELQAGERVYLVKTEVKDNGVVFSLQTCIACDGSDVDLVQMAYRASLNFEFPKGYVETTDFAQIQRAIGQVFSLADLGGASTLQGAAPLLPQGEQSATQPRPVAQPEPARIALGQTPDQVTASLGQPDKVVDLGNKKIFIYRDLKVTFLDGKVSDVQ